jgi:acetylornithine deacetylase/succinyl-diaminopimelate desuccinylase-like protein
MAKAVVQHAGQNYHRRVTHALILLLALTIDKPAVVRELSEFLAIPNVASDEPNIRRNADYLVKMMEKRGISAQILESPAGGPPAVFGELRTPGAKRTIVMYAHYDGQPVVRSEWKTDPWTPTLVGQRNNGSDYDPETRIYARSASDDKGPIVAMMAALDALRAANRKPAVNLKFFFEGEEEAGSLHLQPLLEKHKALLAADGWVFCDGPRHPSGKMQVVFGVRGTSGVTLTTFGPARQLHSGHYGNWAPNPVAMLTDLLASMRDGDGNVKIAGFYDDVRRPTASERAAAAALPDHESELKRTLLVAKPEGGGERLPSRLLAPSVNFSGISGGTLGVNAIASEASAYIDFRLVPNQTPERIRTIVEKHIRERGFTIVHERPADEQRRTTAKLVQLDWNEGYAAARTSIDLPFSQSILRTVANATGEKPLVVPTFGGSLPLYIFEQTLGAPFVIVPTVNSDNNQHAANENLRLGNLFDAIEIFAAIYSEP